MKRPLGFVALFYGGGLILAEFFQPPLFFLFTLAFTLAALALILPRTRIVLLWPLIILTAWANLLCRTEIISPHDLRVFLTDPEEVIIRGRLLESPDERVYLRDGIESRRTLAELSITEIKRSQLWHPAHGRLAVVTSGVLGPEYFSGQEVEISGVIASPPLPVAPGLFNYRAYLKRHGIYFQLKAASPNDWQLLSVNRSPLLADRFLSWAKLTMARGLPDEDKALQLLWAMTLGSRNVLTRDTYDPFVQSGTMHIFAISGLHIALIAGILVSLSRVMRVSRAWCGVIIIPLLWFYTGATGWQSSAIRSTLMMSIIIAGWSLRRPTDLLNSLAAAALIILIFDPQQLFQASFQLSFFVVLSIALFLPPLEKMRDRLLLPDPMLPVELIPKWKRWLGLPLRFAATAIITSSAAWLGAWPITVYYFHLFSPVTLVANVLIVPASSAALACNLASLICGSWLPALGVLFNHSGWFWMTLMMQTGELAVKLPGAFFYATSPHIADFILYYGALLALLTGFALERRRRVWIAAAVILILFFYIWRASEARATTQITAVPLNGGSMVYSDAAGMRNDLLVDCGNNNSVEFVVEPFLRAHGVNRLSRLVLTHGDANCVGGTELLRSLLPIRQIVTSEARFRSPNYRSILDSLRAQPERWQQTRAGEQIGCWKILHPSGNEKIAHADDGVLVLKGELHGVRVLLLSELGRMGQERLLKEGADLRAEIVVAGIPNQGEPLRDELLDAIQPRIIVITDSDVPVSKRASSNLQERLATRGIPVIYTRVEGAATITLRKNKWILRTNTRELRGTNMP